MDKLSFKKATYSGIELQGLSLAGIGTCFTWPEIKTCFDVAQGLPFAKHMNTYLITHGHMDHAAGIPYLISQKALLGIKPGVFYMPPSMVEPLTQIMNTWQKLENHQYEYEFIGVEENKYYEINRDFGFRIFPTPHRIPSNGYTVFRKKKKLKKEFLSLSQGEILKLKSQKKELEDIIYEPQLSFTGDTKIEFLDQYDWIKKSKVLIMEVTYIDEKRPVSEARQWGHIHLEELLPRLKDIQSEKIVLIHLSSRHRHHELINLLDKYLTGEQRNRIEVFPH